MASGKVRKRPRKDTRSTTLFTSVQSLKSADMIAALLRTFRPFCWRKAMHAFVLAVLAAFVLGLGFRIVLSSTQRSVDVAFKRRNVDASDHRHSRQYRCREGDRC